VFGLMLPAVAPVVWLSLVWRTGIARPAGMSRASAPTSWSAVSCLMLLAGSALLVTPRSRSAPTGCSSTALSTEVHAPWFFLWIQELLRMGDPLWLGVALPVAALALLGLLPYAIDRGTILGRWLPRDGRPAQILALALALGWGLLTLRGTLR
jgi:hypothetical protein